MKRLKPETKKLSPERMAQVEGVRTAYRVWIKQIHDKLRRPPEIKEGSVLEANALKTFALCEENGVSLITYMTLAGQLFSYSWLKRVLGADYPPLGMMLSEKTRGKIRMATQKAELNGTIESRAQLYQHLLSGIPRREALSLLDNGFCQEKAVVDYLKRNL